MRHRSFTCVTDRLLISSVNRPTSSSDLLRQLLADSALTFGRICFSGIRFVFTNVSLRSCAVPRWIAAVISVRFSRSVSTLARGTTPPPGKPRREKLCRVFWCVFRALEADHSFPLLPSPREQVADSLSHSRGRSLQRSLPLNHVLPRTTRCTRKPTRARRPSGHQRVLAEPTHPGTEEAKRGPWARRGGPALGFQIPPQFARGAGAGLGGPHVGGVGGAHLCRVTGGVAISASTPADSIRGILRAKRALGLSQVPLLLSVCGQPVFGASCFSVCLCVSVTHTPLTWSRLGLGLGLGLGVNCSTPFLYHAILCLCSSIVSCGPHRLLFSLSSSFFQSSLFSENSPLMCSSFRCFLYTLLWPGGRLHFTK